jgi:D-glycero-alpha-D-manno-heptose-7-phosphate kinase
MLKAGIDGGVDVVILSDIPHTGSGLGSSSSLTVGLLNAFYRYRGIEVSSEILAQQACEIEIDVLKKPIGKQDQYIAAYGGLNLIRFKPGGMVDVHPVEPGYDVYSELGKYLLLFYTGIGRKAEGILAEQSTQIPRTRPILREMKEQVASAMKFIFDTDIEQIGHLMRSGWTKKKQLAAKVSNIHINRLIEKTFEVGATGAKITGAGGGGFLLVFCKPEFHNYVRSVLTGLKEYHFTFDKQGSRVLLSDFGEV